MFVLLMLALAVAATADCPLNCDCKWRSGKESTLCPRAGITSVPSRLVANTQLLDLTGNRLENLTDDIFATAGLINLQRLYLPECSLKSIEPYTFRSLINLVELDLSHNLLESIPSHAFDSVRELRELRLSGNPIREIRNEAFIALPNLVKLWLSSCKLTIIQSRGFLGLESSLEHLELNDNRLQVIHVAVLAPLRSLKIIELSNNPWECTCALRPLRDWMGRRNLPVTVVPDCAAPPRLMSVRWNKLDLEDYACEPVVSAASSNVKGFAGDNVILACRVSGVPAPRVRWVRGGRLLSNTSATNVNSGRAFMLRSERHYSNLTIKSADVQDAGLYKCSAENKAGKAELHFNLILEKKPDVKYFSGQALIAGVAVSALVILSSCLLVLCVYETRKKRQLDTCNEQIVTINHRGDSYEKINTSFKDNCHEQRVLSVENGRKRGDYRNVPSDDPEDDFAGHRADDAQEDGGRPMTPPSEVRWCQSELRSKATRSNASDRDLHIPHFIDYNTRSNPYCESDLSSNSTSVTSSQVGNRRFDYNSSSYSRTKPCERFDYNGVDSEKNSRDAIEMNALGTSAYLRNELKRDPYYFCTVPRRRDGDSCSPLLNSRRNSSGADSTSITEKSRQRSSQRSNSFLDLTGGGNRTHRNPSLPTSPSRENSMMPSSTPLLDLYTLRYFSRLANNTEGFDFRTSELERFLDEYNTLRDQFSIMQETREQLERARAVKGDESESVIRRNSGTPANEAAASAAMADAASPLVLTQPEYVALQHRTEWLGTLYRDK